MSAKIIFEDDVSGETSPVSSGASSSGASGDADPSVNPGKEEAKVKISKFAFKPKKNVDAASAPLVEDAKDPFAEDLPANWERKLILRSRQKMISTSTLRCFEGINICNLFGNCIHACIYCYEGNQESKLVVLGDFETGEVYSEAEIMKRTVGKLVDEMTHKRKKVSKVYFSTTCDLFQPHPLARKIAHFVLKELLSRGVQVSFLSKGYIPSITVELLKQYPSQVEAQIGIITVDDAIRQKLEPYAATADQRLITIQRLLDSGIYTSIRLDPIFAQVTDDEKQFEELFRAVGRLGDKNKVSVAAMSYLFIRKSFMRYLVRAYPDITKRLIMMM